MANRSIVYVDGLNLYYGALRGTPYKWLNLQRLFHRLRQHDDIQQVKYFAAPITGDGQERQSAYLAALATCSEVEVVLGKFKMRKVSPYFVSLLVSLSGWQDTRTGRLGR